MSLRGIIIADDECLVVSLGSYFVQAGEMDRCTSSSHTNDALGIVHPPRFWGNRVGSFLTDMDELLHLKCAQGAITRIRQRRANVAYEVLTSSRKKYVCNGEESIRTCDRGNHFEGR
jgi:hypothetical protein